MKIQNISQRPGHRDTYYDTGDWAIGQVKDVPTAVAKMMLKHTDVYALYEDRPPESDDTTEEMIKKAELLLEALRSGNEASARLAATALSAVKLSVPIPIETVVIDNTEAEHIHDVINKITQMDKKQAVDYIKANFGQDIDLRKQEFRGEGAVQRHALMLFNQYGEK